ncbi:unnamed protein product [Calicophoron daubneyi]|uniref:Methylosome subunit pICln n=1 Tax=Calicophoron daubneyi TaxID=300641 RepID=A0AAV2TU47_CALDB
MVVAPAVTHSISLQERDVVLFNDHDRVENGTLCISDESVKWEGESRSFSIPYKQITLHAISKDPIHTSGDQENNFIFPYPHLLVMVDGAEALGNIQLNGVRGESMTAAGGDEAMAVDEENGAEEDNNSDSESRASDCPGETTILRFVPSNPIVLENLYETMANCQALNPDSDELSQSDLEEALEENEEDEGHVSDGDDPYPGVPATDGNTDEFDPEQFADI